MTSKNKRKPDPVMEQLASRFNETRQMNHIVAKRIKERMGDEAVAFMCHAGRAKPQHPESDLQTACVHWFRYQYPQLQSILFAVPNGGSRNKIEAGRLKAEGVTAGVADLILLTPRGKYGCLCIEMKAGNKSQQETQKEWQKATETAGNKYIICRSIEDFMTEVNNYLNT